MSRVVIITGGTSGIGLATVRLLDKAGYKIYSLSRDKDKINEVNKELPNIHFVQCDCSKISQVTRAINHIEHKEGRIDILINNAGQITAGGIEELILNEWESDFRVNVNSVFNCTKLCLPALKNSDNASIVNVSSISSELCSSSLTYSCFKATVDMMTKTLAKDLAKYGIRVNSVNPGFVNTGFQINNNLMNDIEYGMHLLEMSKQYPLGVGEAIDVANLIEFLISDKAKWITGCNYVIDGGRLVN